MADKTNEAKSTHAPPELFSETTPVNYMVVARRFRPQTFVELIGQDQVAKALRNAIERDRVGHAYLFTGARGVGKTSTARIFAKCLNCVTGPTDTPCGVCDVCLGVAQGEDIDVLEIDGASNRGIEEIRQLRANVNVRPSRARYKIYIIDEVHMLTTPAFNALLKTLEEPPSHVKFFFCTTDPEKIPITVRSRCQRFDLPPISMEQIKDQLRHIAEQDQVQVEEEVLDILARRANGSMRDSQSLLDQLFSFCGNTITPIDVHALLGTADSKIVLEILEACVRQDTKSALHRIASAVDGGVDAGQLNEQLLNLFRDMMALHVGCPPEQVLFCNSADLSSLTHLAKHSNLEQILATIDILDSALTRMRNSTHVRTLLETAVVRVCSLPDLQQVANLIEQLKTGAPAATTAGASSHASNGGSPIKKKTKLTDSGNGGSVTADTGTMYRDSSGSVLHATVEAPDTPSATTQLADVLASEGQELRPRDSSGCIHLQSENCEQVWQSVLQQIDDMTSDLAAMYESFHLVGDRMVVTMKDAYHRDACQRIERKQRLESELGKLIGRDISLDFQSSSNGGTPVDTAVPKESRVQKIRRFEQQPFIKQALELFDGEITDVIEADKDSQR